MKGDLGSPVVLMSPSGFESDGNPYNRLLSRAITSAGVSVKGFTFGRALLGHYSVLHVHWPDALLYARTPVRAVLKAVALRLVMVRLRITRTPLVWTVHNVRPHEVQSRVTMRALAAFERQVTLSIHLSNASVGTGSVLARIIPHGPYEHSQGSGRGRVGDHLLFFGLVRPYKGIAELIEAFGNVRGGFALKICGPVWAGAAQYAEHVVALGESLPGVRLDLRRLSEEELDAEIDDSAGVVLPYADMLNSGALLRALSGGRAVLAPRSAATVELVNELGAHWIVLFDPPLQAADLELFWGHVSRGGGSQGRPDFSRRQWSFIGLAHREAYEAARKADRLRGRQSGSEVGLVGT